MYVENLKIDTFDSLIQYCSQVDPDFNVFVDGGAGLGETANQMLRVCGDSVKIILAFEPYPPNLQAFKNNDFNKIRLIPSAIGAKQGIESFVVSQTTKKLDGNIYHVDGTSFVGKLSTNTSDANASVKVPVERLFDVMERNNLHKIDFLKLDLQGGELDALLGLGSFLNYTKIMWMEYSGQPGLIQHLERNNFSVFDTEYLFVGEPNNLIEDLFYITRSGQNSIGKRIFFGYRKHEWKEYEKTLEFMRRRRRLIQTDLVVVNNDYINKITEYLTSHLTTLNKFVPVVISGIK